MLSVITPTFNEAENIENLVVRVDRALSKNEYELIIVDDDSPDGTGRIAGALSVKYPVRVLNRRGKSGLASAVIDGFATAKGDLLCVMDADLSHPPEIIPEMVECLNLENADIVVASRAAKGGGAENWPVIRRMMSSFAALLARPLTGVQDNTSGFFLLKKEVIGASLTPRGYKILLEILVKSDINKAVEFPYIFRDRKAGETKLNLKVQLEYLTQLFDLYIHAIKRKTRQYEPNERE